MAQTIHWLIKTVALQLFTLSFGLLLLSWFAAISW